MYWIAFTLGLFGSLHCIGMCGPLAIAVLSPKGDKGMAAYISSFSYNFGRTFGYIILGLLFGIVGSFISLGGMQKVFSVGVGILLVIFFVFSVNPDQLIGKLPVFKDMYKKVNEIIYNMLQKSRKVPSFYLGLVNGFLPCGLVYIAIAGAISLSNVWGSVGFMLFFGLGTFPAMIAVILGHQVITQSLRLSFRKLYPFISLVLGVYLIYRGGWSKLPLELNFFEALKNPIMCH